MKRAFRFIHSFSCSFIFVFADWTVGASVTLVPTIAVVDRGQPGMILRYRLGPETRLPRGLQINRTTGVLSGKPEQAGRFVLAVDATEDVSGSQAAVTINGGTRLLFSVEGFPCEAGFTRLNLDQTECIPCARVCVHLLCLLIESCVLFKTRRILTFSIFFFFKKKKKKQGALRAGGQYGRMPTLCVRGGRDRPRQQRQHAGLCVLTAGLYCVLLLTTTWFPQCQTCSAGQYVPRASSGPCVSMNCDEGLRVTFP